MPVIEISTEEDRLLRQIAPHYLQGPKKAGARISWLLVEALQRRGVDPPDNGNGESSAVGTAYESPPSS